MLEQILRGTLHGQYTQAMCRHAGKAYSECPIRQQKVDTRPRWTKQGPYPYQTNLCKPLQTIKHSLDRLHKSSTSNLFKPLQTTLNHFNPLHNQPLRTTSGHPNNAVFQPVQATPTHVKRDVGGNVTVLVVSRKPGEFPSKPLQQTTSNHFTISNRLSSLQTISTNRCKPFQDPNKASSNHFKPLQPTSHEMLGYCRVPS